MVYLDLSPTLEKGGLLSNLPPGELNGENRALTPNVLWDFNTNNLPISSSNAIDLAIVRARD
jgi:hypothetical protein